MQNNNETESRINALKAQIALVKQDRENIHRTIQDRRDCAEFQEPSRSYATIIALPTLAILGVLGGLLLAKVHAETVQADKYNSSPIYQYDSDEPLEPEADVQDSKLDTPSDPIKATGPSNTTAKGPKIKTKGKGRGKKPPHTQKVTEKNDPDDLDFDKCGDDPLCGKNLGK